MKPAATQYAEELDRVRKSATFYQESKLKRIADFEGVKVSSLPSFQSPELAEANIRAVARIRMAGQEVVLKPHVWAPTKQATSYSFAAPDGTGLSDIRNQLKEAYERALATDTVSAKICEAIRKP